MKCSKCGNEFEGKFCPECGTKAVSEYIIFDDAGQHENPQSPYERINVSPSTRPAPKKQGCLKILLVTLIALVVIFVVAVSAFSGKKADKNNPTKDAAIAGFEKIGCEYADMCIQTDDWAEGERFSLYYNEKHYIAYIKNDICVSVRCQEEGLDYYYKDGEVLKIAK